MGSGISARGLATIAMLLLTGAARVMSSNRETETSNTQLMSLSSGMETGSAVPETKIKTEETFIVAPEILVEVLWTSAEMGNGTSQLTAAVAPWQVYPW